MAGDVTPPFLPFPLLTTFDTTFFCFSSFCYSFSLSSSSFSLSSSPTFRNILLTYCLFPHLGYFFFLFLHLFYLHLFYLLIFSTFSSTSFYPLLFLLFPHPPPSTFSSIFLLLHHHSFYAPFSRLFCYKRGNNFPEIVSNSVDRIALFLCGCALLHPHGFPFLATSPEFLDFYIPCYNFPRIWSRLCFHALTIERGYLYFHLFLY